MQLNTHGSGSGQRVFLALLIVLVSAGLAADAPRAARAAPRSTGGTRRDHAGPDAADAGPRTSLVNLGTAEPWRAALQLGYYKQFDSGGIPQIDEDESVFEALILVDGPVAKRDRVGAQLLVDVVSSASIARRHNRQFRALQSGASGVVHADIRPHWSHAFDSWDLSVHGSGSWDYAYYSVGGGVSAAFRFLNENATLRLATRAFYDTLAMIRFNGIDEPDDHRWTVNPEIGWTHVLTPLTVLDLSVDFTTQGGFLAAQFNSVFVNGVEMAETLPGERQRIAGTVRLKQGAGERHAFDLGARYYHDDWGIDAGTFDIGYEVWLNAAKSVLLRTAYRFHVQGPADAYQASFDREKARMTSDPDLGDFLGHMGTLGLSLVSPFGPSSGIWSAEGNYYHRTNGLDMFWVSIGWRTGY